MGRATLVTLALLCSCGRIAFDPLAGAVDGAGDAAPRGACASFGAPMLVPAIESAAIDWTPTLSADGNILVFGRANATSTGDLFISTRTAGAWSVPVAIAALNTTSIESDPEWNATGDRLYFMSDRSGTDQLYVSAYNGTFAPAQLVPGLETLRAVGPALSSDELELFYTIPNMNNSDIGRATRSSLADVFVDRGEVTELSSAVDDGWPTLTPDGLTIYFESTRPVFSPTYSEIYTATRPSIGAAFGPVTPVAGLDDTGGASSDPSLGAGGTVMVFGSNRPGSSDFDVYFSTCNL